MFKITKSQIINAPINEVFPFFERPENLERITPKNLGFVIKTAKPLIMKKGAKFNYNIKLGLVKFPWETLITKYNPPYSFQDIQTFGPYKKWKHTHEFVDLGNKTKISDTIEYELFPKFLSNIINRVYIKKKVEDIFDYRTKILKDTFSKKENFAEEIS